MKLFGEYIIRVKRGKVKLPDKCFFDGEVIIIGCGDHIEIWRKGDYDKKTKEFFEGGMINEI